MSEQLAPQRDVNVPEEFTQEILGWVSWLEPVAEADLTEVQYEAMIQRGRAKQEYFRLLAHDPAVLLHRTRADFDIFFNKAAGLPRADREIAAAAASRLNGCVYCASVHARFASHHAKRTDDVQRLLDDGVSARTDARWDAIVDATVALTETPSAFDESTLDALADAGLGDDEVYDVILAGGFFNWANRLMLTLGEPELPQQK